MENNKLALLKALLGVIRFEKELEKERKNIFDNMKSKKLIFNPYNYLKTIS